MCSKLIVCLTSIPWLENFAQPQNFTNELYSRSIIFAGVTAVYSRNSNYGSRLVLGNRWDKMFKATSYKIKILKLEPKERNFRTKIIFIIPSFLIEYLNFYNKFIVVVVFLVYCPLGIFRTWVSQLTAFIFSSDFVFFFLLFCSFL